MTAEELCTCCDLPLYSCGRAIDEQARKEQRARRTRALAEPGVVAAQHHIRSCPGCGNPVPAGDPIRRTDDGWVGVFCCGRLDD